MGLVFVDFRLSGKLSGVTSGGLAVAKVSWCVCSSDFDVGKETGDARNRCRHDVEVGSELVLVGDAHFFSDAATSRKGVLVEGVDKMIVAVDDGFADSFARDGMTGVVG